MRVHFCVLYLIIYESAGMQNGVGESLAVDEILFSHSLPHQHLPTPQPVERVVLISASHAGYQHHPLHPGLFSGIDLCLLPQPINLRCSAKVPCEVPVTNSQQSKVA